MTILNENWKELISPSVSLVRDYERGGMRIGVVVVEPLERGFGSTLGNSLRRVMMSCLRGYAVISIQIKGVAHEYSIIEGVKEDVMEIIANIKLLVINGDSSQSCVIKLIANKKGAVTAGSIECPEGFEILNKDLIICNLEDGGLLDIVMTVENGSGYRSADSETVSSSGNAKLGEINVSALFNPIKQVSYKIENARVGQRTDYDRLVFNIETNAMMTPVNAVCLASKIIQSQIKPLITAEIIEVDEASLEKEKEEGCDYNSVNPNLLKSIDEVELSVRSYNCLNNEGIAFVWQLVQKTEGEMLRTANFGRKSLSELRSNLASMGLSFGMKLEGWQPPLDKVAKLGDYVKNSNELQN